MVTWIVLAVLAQLISAGIVLVDKYVLVSHQHLGKPVVYAFYISIMSGFVLVLVPFGVISVPSLTLIVLSLLASATFILSVLFLYTALKRGNASDAVPIVGAVSAVVTAHLAFIFLHQDLPRAFLPAFILLVIGTVLISHFKLTWNSLGLVMVSGVFFAASAVLIKLIFQETTFIDGFFWSRMTNVIGALFLLAVPANRRAIFHGYRASSHGMKWLVVSNKALGGVAAFLTLLAISMGSVTIVNALAGLQFVFLLSFAFFCARWFPGIFRGEVHKHQFPHQVYGILCIVGGLAALFLV
ncbi:MAG: DMT family transporter [bacterium]|nr:DMT family transporter [bacterium]